MTAELIEENYNELHALALQAARSIRKRFPMVDEADLIQTGLFWCVQHPAKLAEYLDDDDKKRGTRLLVASLRNAAKDYARRQRAWMYGYDLSDDHFYSVSTLKGTGRGNGLLHYIFDVDAWMHPPSRDEAKRSLGDPAEGNSWVATLVDVSRAVELLEPDDRWMIHSHFRDGRTYLDIGKWENPPVSSTTVAKRIDRAVVKVQETLGGFRPRYDPPEDGWEDGYVGTRKAISNAHARAITGADYEGD